MPQEEESDCQLWNKGDVAGRVRTGSRARFPLDGRGAIEWGVTAPPETFIIDGEGRVLYRHAGPLVRARLLEPFGMLWISQMLTQGAGRNWAFATVSG